MIAGVGGSRWLWVESRPCISLPWKNHEEAMEMYLHLKILYLSGSLSVRLSLSLNHFDLCNKQKRILFLCIHYCLIILVYNIYSFDAFSKMWHPRILIKDLELPSHKKRKKKQKKKKEKEKIRGRTVRKERKKINRKTKWTIEEKGTERKSWGTTDKKERKNRKRKKK